MKRWITWIVGIAAGVFLLRECLYLVEPGLYDLHIRKAIQTLNELQCAEIVEGCEELYRAHIDSLPESGMVLSEIIPKAAADVGYKQAIVRRDTVMFKAGAGSFSRIGPIVILCWMNEETREAKYLALDDGRTYSPKKKSFVENR